MAPPIIITRQIWWPFFRDASTSLCGILNDNTCQPVSVKFFRQRITFFLAGNFFGTGDGQRAGTDMTGYA